MTPRSTALRAVVRVSRLRPVRSALLRVAAARRRSLVLVYHTVCDRTPRNAVVPPIPPMVLRGQLETLSAMGDVVSLAALMNDHAEGRRPRFAITFDDDDVAHVTAALPVLRELGLTATFFLSGRALHGIGPYWWQLLQQLIDLTGVEAAARFVGIPAATPAELAQRCEGDPAVLHLERVVKPVNLPQLDASGIRALSDAGMAIGFHTLHHPVLPLLHPEAQLHALTFGRDELGRASGQAIRFVAYPHGRADSRIARLAAEAGYEAAFAGGGLPIGEGMNRFLLPRWDPGAIAPAEFAASLALRLHRPITRSRTG